MYFVYIHIPFCSHICSYCAFTKFYYNEHQVNNYLKYSNTFSNSECEEYLRYLANIDYELKQGLIKEEHALDQIFIEI